MIVPKIPTIPRNSWESKYSTECSRPTCDIPKRKAAPRVSISPTRRLLPVNNNK